MRSGLSISIFLSSIIKTTRLKGPITRDTWIKFFIKGSKTASKFIISTAESAITTDNLDSESDGMKYISSGRFTYCFKLVLVCMCIFFLVLGMCGKRPNIRLDLPHVLFVKQQTQIQSRVSFL